MHFYIYTRIYNYIPIHPRICIVNFMYNSYHRTETMSGQFIAGIGCVCDYGCMTGAHSTFDYPRMP